ncbi:MAG: TonB-dependent receptor [Cellvibrio sp.]
MSIGCNRLVAASLLLLMASRAAAESKSVDFLSLSLEELLQTKITSSTLTDESLRSVPSSMTVFTQADIRRFGLSTLSQLANLVPGYQSYHSDNNGLAESLSSRGRRQGNLALDILILVDGQRLNNDWSGSALQDDMRISLENVARVEFIRGPSSAIYGSNATMGVINIITASATELSVDVGSDQYGHAGLQWHAKGEQGSFSLYASRVQTDGQELTVYEPFTNPATPVYQQTRDPYSVNDLYIKAELGEFALNGRLTQGEAEQFYVVGYVDNDINRYGTYSDSLHLSWRHTLVDDIKLEGHIFTSHKSLEIHTATSLIPYRLISGGVREKELGSQWLLQGDGGKAHWLLGWEWRNPTLVNTMSYGGPPSNPTQFALPQAPENGRIINGLFGQYQRPLSDHLVLTLGLRHDSYSDVGSHLSPRFALVEQLGTSDTLKLLYSEAFRAPSRIETSIINSPGFLSNPQLQPETAKTTELVWLHLLREGFLSATLYRTAISDAIKEFVTPALQRTWRNGKQSISGMELEWQYQWLDHWRMNLALTHIIEPVGFIHSGSSNLLGGGLSYSNQRWTASLLVNYQGSRRDPNEQNIPINIASTEYTDFGGRTLFGAHFSYLTANRVELYLHAENLLDKHYVSPAGRPINYVGVPGEGRALTAGLRWTLK